MPFKPHLACDVDLDKLKYPVAVLPKIDGVRGLNVDGLLFARSMKRFKNKYMTEVYSKMCYSGFDGEFAAGEETDADLCRRTSSATGTIEGEPSLTWHVFDICTEHMQNTPYEQRYVQLKEYVDSQHQNGEMLDIKVVPMYIVNNKEELEEWETTWLEMGYEGMIIRKLDGKNKQGRCTVREGAYLRLKRFIEEDAVVKRIVEGVTNGNEAQTNELGHTFRSTHQANMIPNGMVGSLVCVDVKSGREIEVGPGSMTHADRRFYFENQSALIDQTIKYKHFPKGVKDKLRFPLFVSIRSETDIV